MQIVSMSWRLGNFVDPLLEQWVEEVAYAEAA